MEEFKEWVLNEPIIVKVLGFQGRLPKSLMDFNDLKDKVQMVFSLYNFYYNAYFSTKILHSQILQKILVLSKPIWCKGHPTSRVFVILIKHLHHT